MKLPPLARFTHRTIYSYMIVGILIMASSFSPLSRCRQPGGVVPSGAVDALVAVGQVEKQVVFVVFLERNATQRKHGVQLQDHYRACRWTYHFGPFTKDCVYVFFLFPTQLEQRLIFTLAIKKIKKFNSSHEWMQMLFKSSPTKTAPECFALFILNSNKSTLQEKIKT